MILEVPKNNDNINIAGEFESQTAGIDESSLPFILEMLSKNFYSNPIGSIVREYTSNCFDSHVEANIDDAVVIKIDEDEEGEYISFIDVGVGLSPDRIKNIFMKYFTSTKRESNNMIGAYGLGSKSALAYSDYFYITTIFDNIKYSYLYSKGTTLPTLDLLAEESIQQHSGTEIKIYIKNHNDKYRFIQELKSQLSYFDSVYFQGCNIDNEYKIYENDLFKYRNQDQYSDEAHIVFGKVAYPIDWEQIGEKYLEVPIGIKFDISELVVTPNREMLRYTDEVKALVKKRVQESVIKLKEMYLAKARTHDDFFDWYNAKNSRKFLYFSETDYVELKGFDLPKTHSLKIIEELGLDYSILKDNIIGKLYSTENQIENYKIKKYNSHNNLTETINDYSNSFLYCSNSNFSSTKNFIHGNKRILQFRGYKHIARLLDNNRKFIKNIVIDKELKKHINTYTYDGYKNHYVDKYFDLGLGMKLYKLIKYFKELVESKIDNYHFIPTQEQIQSYKDYQDQYDYAKKRKLEGKIFCKGVSIKNDFDWKLQEIEDYKGIVIYGFRDDIKKLEKAVTYCYLQPNMRLWEDNFNHYSRSSSKSYQGTINPKACKIIQIAQSNEKHFKNKKNMVHVTQMYGDNKLFRKLASSYRIEILLGEYLKNYSEHRTETFIDYFNNINKEIGKIFKELYDYHKSFTSPEDIKYTRIVRADLKREVIDVATKNNLFDVVIESKIKILEDYFKGVEMLKHIDFNNNTLPAILKYLKEHKKKINLEYYCKVVTPELIPEFNFDEKIEEVTKYETIMRKIA